MSTLLYLIGMLRILAQGPENEEDGYLWGEEART